MKCVFSHLFFLLLGLVIGVGGMAVAVKKCPDVRAAVLAGAGCCEKNGCHCDAKCECKPGECKCENCKCGPNGKCAKPAVEKKGCCEKH